jgi:fumarate reductase subunit C
MSFIPDKYKKWSTLIGGVLIHLPLGAFYTFGNMCPYVASYLREYDGFDTIRYSDIVWILSVTSLATSISAIFVNFLQNKLKLSLKIIALIGCLLNR